MDDALIHPKEDTFILIQMTCKRKRLQLIFKKLKWVKSPSKEPPKWIDTPLNCIFVCLKNHKGSIIVWIVIIIFGIFFIVCIHAQNLGGGLHVQNTQILKVDNPYFFRTSFFSIKCTPFLLKIKKIVTLMIRREKGFELMISF